MTDPAPSLSDRIQFRRYGEWTMVYLNGKLIRAGDHYLADEWLQQRYAVEVVDDDKGLCMTNLREAVPTLAEVEAIERRDAEAIAEADRLRDEARKLLDRANTIDPDRHHG